MAGYACPCCGEISDTFGRGGGENMAKANGVQFLGRVPIDTVLVGLLDAVSKGEVAATGVTSTGESVPVVSQGQEAVEQSGAAGSETSENGSRADADTAANGIGAIQMAEDDFPLLSRYNKTASAKVWTEIARGVVDGIDERRRTILERLEGAA